MLLPSAGLSVDLACVMPVGLLQVGCYSAAIDDKFHTPLVV